MAIGLLALPSACATAPEPAETKVVEQPKEPEDAAKSAAKERQRKREVAFLKRPAVPPEMENKLARLQLSLLEKEAQIKDWERKLGEAIKEIVRTKARLRSQESKAEAASNLAEAEVALKTFKADSSGLDKLPEFAQASALMRMSADELKNENYGGSLYLTNQAKLLLKEAQERSQTRERMPLIEGEVPLALPLPLKVVKEGTVRKGPSGDAGVVWTVQPGTSLIGHSYKGQWVHVQNETGEYGWISYSLIAGQ